jgi:parallel beta-helix repeat protein
MNTVLKKVILIWLFTLTACQTQSTQIIILPTPETHYASPSKDNTNAQTYYVSSTGNDLNNGSQGKPWMTIQKATATAAPNSVIIVRGGTYSEGNEFANSGVTLINYHGEQVIIRLTKGDGYRAFDCYTVRARTDIHIIGSDVTPKILSNGVVSKKGIVIQGEVGSQWAGFLPHGGCDRWEIAGVDFVDVGHAIFQMKESFSNTGDLSSDNWYIHDNRVYRYYRETGMQFNGNDNIIENNEISKVTPQLDTPFGCYLLNLLGHGNIVRGNVLTGTGGGECNGLLFEWSQSDYNLIENNTIRSVLTGIKFMGGDNNTIKNNTIISIDHHISEEDEMDRAGIEIVSYFDSRTYWPCDDYVGSGSSSEMLLPPNDPTHPDYPYYYPWGECQSYGNQIIDNKISGFTIGIMFNDDAPTLGTTIINNNTITEWTRDKVCNYRNFPKGCKILPPNVYIDVFSGTETTP